MDCQFISIHGEFVISQTVSFSRTDINTNFLLYPRVNLLTDRVENSCFNVLYVGTLSRDHPKPADSPETTTNPPKKAPIRPVPEQNHPKPAKPP